MDRSHVHFFRRLSEVRKTDAILMAQKIVLDPCQRAVTISRMVMYLRRPLDDENVLHGRTSRRGALFLEKSSCAGSERTIDKETTPWTAFFRGMTVLGASRPPRQSSTLPFVPLPRWSPLRFAALRNHSSWIRKKSHPVLSKHGMQQGG